MFSSLLPLAEVTSQAAEATGPTKIMQDFGISLPGIAAQVLSVSIVVFILWKFAFKPVLATLDERQQKIASGLQYADEMKAKLEAAQQETAASAKRAQLEATRIIDEARKSAKEFLDKQTQETAAKANDIIAKAQQAIELEKKKMLAEARTEIARLVVVTTQRVLAKELSEADRTRYNESAAKELSNV
jgi:F-type H+-transporting ATPase subunit b